MSDQRSNARLTTVTLILVPVLVIVGFLAAVTIGVGATPPACNPTGPAIAVDPASVPQGPIAGYGHEQLLNAAHIMTAARSLGLTVRDQQIGVMTAISESDLLVLDHGDAAGPDSRGLFQQRDNGAWGSYADRMNPAISATNFFKVEMTVPARETLAPTLVAHTVQNNADPYYYEQFWTVAGTVVQALAGMKTSSAPSAAGGTSRYNLGRVQPATATLANTIGPKFGIKTMGGYRDPAGEKYDVNGHPAGLAIDAMTNDIPDGKATGDRLVAYLVQNAKQLGVKYVIWQQHIWSLERADEGWRLMEDRGSPTQNHMDHVHISLNAGATTTDPGCPGTAPGGTPGTVAATGWARPTDAPVSSPYGWRIHPVTGSRKFHYGVDLAAQCETPIWAANTGVVITASTARGYGHLIEIDHGGGVTTRYGHMYASGMLVRVGDTVTAGQQIARTGSDGTSTACHLHFEVQVNGSNVNPADYLGEAGVRVS